MGHGNQAMAPPGRNGPGLETSSVDGKAISVADRQDALREVSHSGEARQMGSAQPGQKRPAPALLVNRNSKRKSHLRTRRAGQCVL